MLQLFRYISYTETLQLLGKTLEEPVLNTAATVPLWAKWNKDIELFFLSSSTEIRFSCLMVICSKNSTFTVREVKGIKFTWFKPTVTSQFSEPDCSMLWHASAGYLWNLPCRACRPFIRAKQSRGEVSVKQCKLNKTFVGLLWVSKLTLGVVQMHTLLCRRRNTESDWMHVKKLCNSNNFLCPQVLTVQIPALYPSVPLIRYTNSNRGYLLPNLFGVANITGLAKGFASFFVYICVSMWAVHNTTICVCVLIAFRVASPDKGR